MKYSFSFTNASLAKRFEDVLIEERQIKPSVEKDDNGKITISYASEDIGMEGSCDEDEKVSKSEMYECMSDFASYIMKEVQWQMNWISSEISYLSNRFWEHEEGHLPKINSPAQMQKALDTLGLDGDYEVEKRRVYASNGTVRIDSLS